MLANEQVLNGKCERSGDAVERREMEQWFFKITAYADQLLDFSGLIDWPEPIRLMQTNWIGRSEGVDVSFDISEYGLDVAEISTFTTRIDTVFGVTFLALAPEHPLVSRLATPERRAEVEEYAAASRRSTEIERMSTEREKTGVFTGAYAVNRLNGERVPILAADYVLLSYGSGAVMGVPAHDERDFEFATKYGLDIRVVVAPPGWAQGEALERGLRGQGGNAGQLGRVRRPVRPRGLRGDRGQDRAGGLGQAHGVVPDARLAHLAPALLGRTDSHPLLRRLRRRPRSGGGTAGAAAGGRPLLADGRIAPEAARGVRERALSVVRRRRTAGDGHDGHVRRFVVVLPALLEARTTTPRRCGTTTRASGCRWTSTWEARSTR